MGERLLRHVDVDRIGLVRHRVDRRGRTCPRTGLETAVDDVREASETLADDLEDAGRPDTEAGEEAEALLDGLADDLDSGEELESAVEGVSAPATS